MKRKALRRRGVATKISQGMLSKSFAVGRQLLSVADAQGDVEGAGGRGTVPTTSDAVLNAVMKRVVEEGCLDAQYVAPRQALGLLKAKHMPKQLKFSRHLFVAGFDGPAHHGHYYGMHWNAVSKTLVVGDDHPIGKARDLTVVLSKLLQPQKVKYVSLRPAGPGTCADSVVRFFASAARCNIDDSLFPLHRHHAGSIAGLARKAVSGVGIACALCDRRNCSCDEAFGRQVERLKLIEELQRLSGVPVDQAGRFFRPRRRTERASPGCLADQQAPQSRPSLLKVLLALQVLSSLCGRPNDFKLKGEEGPGPAETSEHDDETCRALVSGMASAEETMFDDLERETVLGGAGLDDEDDVGGPSQQLMKLNDLIAKQRFCDAPGLSFDEQKSALFEGGDPKCGEWVRVIRRANTNDNAEITVDSLWRREEIGQIVSVSRSRGTCTVRWEMTPIGFTRELDDPRSFRFQRSTLPASPHGSHDVLFIEKLGETKPLPRARQSNEDEEEESNGESSSGEDTSDVESVQDDNDGPREEQHYSPYAEIDTAEELEAYLFPAYVPDVPADRTHSTESITGKEFLEAKKLSFDSAKARTPSIVWASCAENTRARHIKELKNFDEYLQARPAVLHLPLDVLLAHYFQLQFKSRKKKGGDLAWGSMSTLMGTMIGALASFPMYADSKLAIRPSRWPFFKSMLDAAERMKAKHPPRKIEPATYDDVKEARKHLSEPMQVALIIMWYTASRFSTDVAHLKKKSFRFGDDGDVTVHYTEHKTGKSVGRYTIATSIKDEEARRTLKAFVEALPSDNTFLFPLPAGKAGQTERSRLGAQLTKALRQSRKELEIKSMRQGTLQSLAKLNLTDAQIETFAHHTNMKTLQNYLEGEQVLHETQRQAQRLAAGLAGAGALDDGNDELDVDPTHLMFEQVRSPTAVPLDYWATVDAKGRIAYSALPPDPIKPDRSGYRLHAKPETSEGISWENLIALETQTNETKEFLRAQLVWVSNATGTYSDVPWDGKIRDAALTQEQIQQLLAINNIAAVDDTDRHKVAGTIHIFKVPEDSKMRWRVIKHPVDINIYHGKETVRRTGNTTRRRAREAILEADCCIDLDLAGFFDQLRLEDDASWYQVFRSGKKLFRNLRVPMGARQSPQVATAVTQVLLDFDTRGVRVDYCIDNVRFAGSRSKVVAAAWEFVQRCRRVRAKLNDVDVDTASVADIESRVAFHDADFVGEVADYVNKTVCCRKKHVEKLMKFWSVLGSNRATYRDLFGLYAMLLYMSETLGIRMDHQYAVRKWYSQLARELAAHPEKWGHATPLRPPPECVKWTRQAIANKPARLRRAPAPDVVIIGDACALGYGGLICRRARGKWQVDMVQQRWTKLEAERLQVKHSVASEPEATVRLTRKAMEMHGTEINVVYVTDHLPFVHAVDHGSSMRPEYNARVSRFRDLQPYGELQYEEGSKNIADKYSRFLVTKLTAADEQAAVSLAENIIAERNTGRPCVVEWDKPRGERSPASAIIDGVSPTRRLSGANDASWSTKASGAKAEQGGNSAPSKPVTA